MKVDDAATEFKRRWQKRDGTFTPAAAVAAMFTFYRDVRADQCDLAEDGDMLLFQWGIYGSPAESMFELDITRQFMVADDDEQAIVQLHVVFRFPSDDALAALGTGNRWCSTPAELAEFASFVQAHPAYLAVGSRSDGAYAVTQELV